MTDGSGFGALLQMLPALALIVGALLLVKRWAAKGGRISSVGGVKVLSRTGLTRGTVLAIVEVGGKRYLVGAGEQGVRMLTELDDDVDVRDTIVANPNVPLTAATDSPLTTAQRPWMGLVSRLQAMTVRYPSRPTDASQR